MFHAHFLDTYAGYDSPIHRLPAWVKMLATLCVVAATLATPIRHVLFFTGLAMALLLVAAASQVPGGFIARKILFLEPVVLLAAAMALFQPNGGLIFATIAVRSSICLLTLILLANTTPFSDILRVLRAVRTPALLLTTIALMYRYLFVLTDEARRMSRARACRTFTPAGGIGRFLHWRTLGDVIGRLFVRSSDRAERIYDAMCARGWR